MGSESEGKQELPGSTYGTYEVTVDHGGETVLRVECDAKNVTHALDKAMDQRANEYAKMFEARMRCNTTPGASGPKESHAEGSQPTEPDSAQP
jgi:hypothetical protein